MPRYILPTALLLLTAILYWYLQPAPQPRAVISESMLNQQGSSALPAGSDIQQSWSQSYQTAKIDFALFDFTAKQFSASGVLQQEFTGSKMLHLSPATTQLNSQLPQLRYVISNPNGTWLQGQVRKISASRALADADFAIIDWHHQVQLQQGAAMQKIQLKADNLLQTPQHFNATGKVSLLNKAGKIDAEKLEFAREQQLLNFIGPVHSVYQP